MSLKPLTISHAHGWRMTITFMPAPRWLSTATYSEHFHHFIAQMIDYLYGDAAGRRLVKRARGVAVQGGPGFFVDLGLERGLERFVRIVRAQEIGVADEEALLVIVGVDEPAGDSFRPVTADVAGAGVEHVHTVDFDLYLT